MMIYPILTDLIETAGDSCCTASATLVFHGCPCLILSKADKPERHVFSDASERAIAAFAFVKDLKLENMALSWGRQSLHLKLVHSIPRLELCAAVLGSEKGAYHHAEFRHSNGKIICSTDSKVVLGYLNNKTRRFYTYVRNRVAIIHGHSRP